ncbi:hypothetical protein ACFWPU_00585 [Streptomyces sp. NPDC058471]|uniref:hypothetical protein n=1 Tax=Streptomyces sp. NPDC058471 TaxID=3346516 RepID=UPI00364A0327
MDWSFSEHALGRALDMALDPEDIRQVLTHPDVKQPSGPGYPDHCQVWASNRIALVVSPDEQVVITCLWRGVTYVRGAEDEPYRD